MYRTVLVLVAAIVQYTIKLSICIFLLNIFPGGHRCAVQLTWSLLVLTRAASVEQCVAWGMQAHPLAKLWDPDLEG
ncbi:hypothetical protein F4780DRAFT_720283 [Xylariomycetidae sp. FL0641]|nr:hypothetical protein F4780DRAFT_720283 [Xylariomycetidae sp. FL0641]